MLRTLAGWLHRHGPRPVVAALRAIVESWGTLTARWRMQPTFIVVGAQRAGTTSLYRVLSAHPSVVRPTAAKGTEYFDVNYHRGMRWYRGHFPLRRLTSRRGAVTFESSGYYLFHPRAAERIGRDLPDVKIVVVVRNPVERAYSAHRHELARGFEEEPFETAIALERYRTRAEEERILADPAYQSFEHRHHAYLARGRYAEQIERYIEALGPDRVYVMDADRFFEQPAEEFGALSRWLGLSPWQPTVFPWENARARSPMPAELRDSLSGYFEAHDDRLAQLMGRTPRWREQRSGIPAQRMPEESGPVDSSSDVTRPRCER